MFENFFSFLKPKQRDLSKLERPIRPAPKSLDGGYIANAQLLKGIYTGSAVGFQLSCPSAYTPIKIPSVLVGIPNIKTSDAATQQLLTKLTSLIIDECPIITHGMLLYGTAWRWVKWSDKFKRVVWENIPDESVTDIIVDVNTEEIKEIVTDEDIKYSTGEDVQKNVRRKRHITKETITETLTGDINKKEVYKNPMGFMPIPFAHEALGSDWRGNSVYSRILRTLKCNHDLQYMRDEILAKFKPKIIQHLQGNDFAVNKWLANNGMASSAEIDPFSSDFVVNVGDENTSLLFLAGDATRQHTDAINDNMRKIVIGSGVPEIFWGTLATGGNYNTAYSQVHLGVEYIKSVQREMTKPYKQLINQSLQILAAATFEKAQNISIKWGALDFTSPSERASILATFAGAMSSLINSASITKEQIKYFYDLLFPSAPEMSAELMREGFLETLTEHTSHLGQQTLDVDDLQDFNLKDAVKQ
jgi:hypothetical protein